MSNYKFILKDGETIECSEFRRDRDGSYILDESAWLDPLEVVRVERTAKSAYSQGYDDGFYRACRMILDDGVKGYDNTFEVEKIKEYINGLLEKQHPKFCKGQI